ncbi:MAG: VTT domain-containing protein [bacterium]|nr:VTT domain-containing protein [bacterium]
MELLFLNVLILWPPLGYILIFLGMMLEGDLTLFTAAFLTAMGLFNPVMAIAVAVVGFLLGDWLWYEAGKHIHRLPAFIATRVEKFARPFDERLSSRPFHTILFAKFAYGIHHLILLRSGATKLSLSRFLISDISASIIWFAIVGSLGYFSGYSFFGAGAYLKFGEVAILIGFIGIVAAERLIAYLSKKS